MIDDKKKRTTLKLNLSGSKIDLDVFANRSENFANKSEKKTIFARENSGNTSQSRRYKNRKKDGIDKDHLERAMKLIKDNNSKSSADGKSIFNRLNSLNNDKTSSSKMELLQKNNNSINKQIDTQKKDNDLKVQEEDLSIKKDVTSKVKKIVRHIDLGVKKVTSSKVEYKPKITKDNRPNNLRSNAAANEKKTEDKGDDKHSKLSSFDIFKKIDDRGNGNSDKNKIEFFGEKKAPLPTRRRVVELKNPIQNANKSVESKTKKPIIAKNSVKKYSRDNVYGDYNRAKNKNTIDKEESFDGGGKKIEIQADKSNSNWKLTLNQSDSDEERRRIRDILSSRNRNKSRSNGPRARMKKVFKVVESEKLTIEGLAKILGEKSRKIKQNMKSNHIPFNDETLLDIDLIDLISDIMGHKLQRVKSYNLEDQFQEIIQSIKLKDNNSQNRSPIITIMGHVDHGKTSLLDFFRNSRVIDGEAGGITQHIGAYQITTKNDFKITFLDTPGHEAFSKIRAQGANVTDIVILIVAADDGVMPQTIEAINHAKAAKVPIIVAINKIDKPDTDIEKLKNQLSQYEIISDEWGGEYMFVPISAKTGQNIDKLEEAISLQSEMAALYGVHDGNAAGVVLETKIDSKKGYCATFLIQKGTLRKGDFIIAGESCGTIRTIVNDLGRSVDDAEICQPVEVFGLDSLPESGTYFAVMDSLQDVRDLARMRIENKKIGMQIEHVKQSNDLGSLFSENSQKNDKKELNVIIKADTQGSVDAIVYAINKLEGDEMQIKVSASMVGSLSSSDLDLAQITNSVIVIFGNKPDISLVNIAKNIGIEVRHYNIIYEIVDDIHKLINDILGPQIIENKLGEGVVRKVFGKVKNGLIFGFYITKGIVRREHLRVIRDGKIIHEGKILSMRNQENDATELQAGFECGVTVDKVTENVQEKDKIEIFEFIKKDRI